MDTPDTPQQPTAQGRPNAVADLASAVVELAGIQARMLQVLADQEREQSRPKAGGLAEVFAARSPRYRDELASLRNQTRLLMEFLFHAFGPPQ